nr:MAG TPA: tail length tape measure protein [Caudoviricetes sp.]
MADQVTLLDLNFGTSEAEKGLDALIAKSIALAKTKKDLQAAYASEKKELETLNQNYASGLVQQDKYDATVKKLNKSLIETQKAILDNADANRANNAEIKSTKTLLDNEATSVNALRAQLAQNTVELNKMSEAQRTTSKEGQDLTEQTKALSDKLKELEKSVGDNRRNVGNYAESVKDGILQTQGLTGGTGALVGQMKSGIAGVQAFNAALKANPIIFVVSLVLTLIGIIEKLMKRNSELATSLNAAFAPFKVVFGRLLDWITGLFEGVAFLLENLAKAVTWLLDKLGLISEETKRAAEEGARLAGETQRIYQAETAALVPMAQMRREMEELKTLAADQNKSAAERTKLLEQAREKLHAIRDLELSVLDAKYKQIKAQNALGYSSDEDLRKEQEALAALEAARAQYATQEKEMAGQVSGFIKQERDKQVAAARAAAEKKKKAAEDAAKAEADAYKKAQDELKKAQDQQIKSYQEAVTAMQLDIAQRELEGNEISLQELQAINDKKIEIETYRRSQGLIGEQEYINNVRQLELEYAAEVRARKDEEEQREKDRQAMNMENDRALAEVKMGNDLEFQLQKLEAQKAMEIANAEAIGAETASIVERYEIMKDETKRKYYNAQLEMAAGTAGQLSSLLGEESAAGKAFATAQALINTYLGASKALAQGGIWGIAQAAIVVAAGMKNVMSINKTKEPDTKINTSVRKYAKGGQIYGPSHSAGGVTFTGSNGQQFEAEGGENMYILNRKASGAINALSALNMEYGGRSFGSSGVYRYANGGKIDIGGGASMQLPSNFSLSNDSLRKLAAIMYDSVASVPAPQVAVTDIDAGQQQYNSVQVAANL